MVLKQKYKKNVATTKTASFSKNDKTYIQLPGFTSILIGIQ